MKKMFVVLISIVCLLLPTAAIAYGAEEAPFDYDEENLSSQVDGIINDLVALNEDELEFFIDNSIGVTRSACEEYLSLYLNNNIGEFDKINEYVVSYLEQSVVIDKIVSFKNENIEVKVYFKNVLDNVSPVKIEMKLAAKSDSSIVDKLKNAGINTVMGITTVFVILMLISLLLSFFKYIPIIHNKFSKVEEKQEVIKDKDNKESDENDLELIALITAAISASENMPSDSFVVRSIHRMKG